MLEKNRKFREPHCHILKYTLYFLELMMKSKKNRVLGGFNGSYLRNTVGRAIAFLVSLKEAFSKKTFRKPFFRIYPNFATKYTPHIFNF